MPPAHLAQRRTARLQREGRLQHALWQRAELWADAGRRLVAERRQVKSRALAPPVGAAQDLALVVGGRQAPAQHVLRLRAERSGVG